MIRRVPGVKGELLNSAAAPLGAALFPLRRARARVAVDGLTGVKNN